MQKNNTTFIGKSDLAFSNKSPEPWNFLALYIDGKELKIIPPIIIVFIGTLIWSAIGPLIWIFIFFFVIHSLSAKDKNNKNKIRKKYPDSIIFFTDLSILHFMSKMRIFWEDERKMIQDILKKANSTSPEKFKSYIEELHSGIKDKKTTIFSDRTTIQKDKKTVQQNSHSSPDTSVKAKKTPKPIEKNTNSWKNKDTSTSVLSTGSIWDNYESVLDTMNKKK